jgi:hypothetical protein
MVTLPAKRSILETINWIKAYIRNFANMPQQIGNFSGPKRIISQAMTGCTKKMPHRNAAFVKNQSGSVTPKEN